MNSSAASYLSLLVYRAKFLFSVISVYLVLSVGILSAADGTCQEWLGIVDYYGLIGYNEHAYFEDSFIDDIRPLTEDAVWLVMENSDMGRHRHPAVLSHYRLDLSTGKAAPIPYPDADIITLALTDQLGITEWVFGEFSSALALHLSPDRDRLIFFEPEAEECWDTTCGNYGPATFNVWVADADGGNRKLVAPAVRMPWDSYRWVGDKLFLTGTPDEGPSNNFISVICADGSCFGDVTNVYDIPTHYQLYWHVTPNPNGSQVAIVNSFQSESFDAGIHVVDIHDGSVITLSDAEQSQFMGLWPIWEDDFTVLYVDFSEDLGLKRAYLDDRMRPIIEPLGYSDGVMGPYLRGWFKVSDTQIIAWDPFIAHLVCVAPQR